MSSAMKQIDAINVRDKDSFLDFLSKLRSDLQSNASQWENRELPDFFEAMEAWVQDWNGPHSDNPLQHAAQLFLAARLYE